MPIPIFFIIFLSFIIYLNIKIRKGSKDADARRKEYYERELRASMVRKQPLDDIEILTLNLDKLPLDIDRYDPDVRKYIVDINRLAKLPMASFKGMDNTDLKLKYGIANLNTLIQYESTYLLVLQKLIEWAEVLMEKDYLDEAVNVLEEGIRLGSDLRKNYTLLADLYLKTRNGLQYENLRRIMKERNIKAPISL